MLILMMIQARLAGFKTEVGHRAAEIPVDVNTFLYAMK